MDGLELGGIRQYGDDWSRTLGSSGNLCVLLLRVRPSLYTPFWVFIVCCQLIIYFYLVHFCIYVANNLASHVLKVSPTL